MIFILAPYQEAAENWLRPKGIDVSSVVVITPDRTDRAREHRPGIDTLISLPGAPDDLFFELTVR